MKTNISVLVLCFLAYLNPTYAASYAEAIAEWTSYKDVAHWLSSNFTFDKSRQKQNAKRLKKQGPSGLLVKNPATFYEENGRGFCADSAYFVLKSLNKIDPSYNARSVFIWNANGRPHHWVTAFDLNEKLYIMDYGTGKKWKQMQGIHGPYDSLTEYRDYLASLKISRFEVDRVAFRDMPGQEE
jgi:hypothetical protein